MDFSEEHIKIIQDMLADCKSSAQIAKVIGRTRNSVLGKIHREPELKKLANMRYRPPSTGTGNSMNSRRVVPKTIGSQSSVELPVPTDQLATVGRIMARLGSKGSCRGHCLWPVNVAEPGELHLFCGAPTPEGIYCSVHSPIVTKARQDRKKPQQDYRERPSPRNKRIWG